jgi:hypothetical protein
MQPEAKCICYNICFKTKMLKELSVNNPAADYSVIIALSFVIFMNHFEKQKFQLNLMFIKPTIINRQ